MRWPLVIAVVLAALAAGPVNAQNSRYANKLAPYVASPTHVVDRMLVLANIKPGETVFDLGPRELEANQRVLEDDYRRLGIDPTGLL